MGHIKNVRHDCKGRDHAEETAVEYANGDVGATVVDAVSSAAGVDPKSFDSRLYDVIDPDALSQCVRTGGDDVVVSFTFETYRVQVDGGGTVTVSHTNA